MKKGNQKLLFTALCLLTAFAAWTLLLRFADVKPIGPDGSTVGLAALNGAVHSLTGVNMTLYTLTDWLGLVPFVTALGFAVLGLAQWLWRKSLLRVDRSLIILGVFYAAVIAVYVFFETVVINYRPILIDGALEASYPSSTTLLVMCVMPTAAIQLGKRIRNPMLRGCAVTSVYAFTAFTVVGRILSGVHWISDIIGGMLLSAGLVMIYLAVTDRELN